MSISKPIAIVVVLIASLFGQAADASNSIRARARVTQVDGTDIELQISNGSATIGDVYELYRLRSAAPKSAASSRLVRVGEVRISEVLDQGRVRAVVVNGSPWRRDRAYRSTRDNAISDD